MIPRLVMTVVQGAFRMALLGRAVERTAFPRRSRRFNTAPENFSCFAAHAASSFLPNATFVLLLVPFLCFMGCGRQAATNNPAVTNQAEAAGVRVLLKATAADVEVGRPIRVTLEVLAEGDRQVAIENYGHALTQGDRAFQYRVTRSGEHSGRTKVDGKQRWYYEYDVEFILPERYELPGAVVHVTERPVAAGESPTSVEVRTEPLPLTVRGAVASTPEEMKKIRVLDPWDLPGLLGWWGWAAAIAGGIGILLFWAIRRSGRVGRPVPAVQVPAHEWAYRELTRLSSDRLVESGRLQDFFYRISGIVRGYVERRFSVMAPEMTTEEFLAAMSRDPRFSRDHRHELTEFLSECDLVKYARYEASRQECDMVMTAARRYVDQTRDGHPETLGRTA